MNQGANPQTFWPNGMTLYNLVFDKTAIGNVDQAYIIGTFTVNDLTFKNSAASGSIEHKGNGSTVININGNLNFPVTAGAGEVRFGFSGGQILANLYGNLVMSDANAVLRSNITFVGATTQTVSQTLGTITGGAWIVNKTNAGDTITLLTDLSGSQSITMTQGTFDATGIATMTAASYSQSGTSIFKAPVSLTINNGDFTYTAGTFTHNNGAVAFYNNSNPRYFSAGSIVMYDLLFDKGIYGSQNSTYISGTFTVNNLTVRNTYSSQSLLFNDGGGATTITVKGNLDLPSTPGVATVLGFGSANLNITLNLYGNLTISDAQATLFANINFVGAGAQTITQATGTISGATWTINKTNPTDTVTLLTNISGTQNVTITQGTFSVGAYTAALGALTLNGGTFEATNSASITVNSYAQAVGSTMKAPVSLTVNKGNFTYTAGTFTHNNGTLSFINNSTDRYFAAGSIVLYDLFFDKTYSGISKTYISGTFTVNNLTAQNSDSYQYLVFNDNGSYVANITVNGNLSFPSSPSSAYAVEFGNSSLSMTINLNGNLTMSDAQVKLHVNANFVGALAQTITQATGTIPGGTWTVNKTNLADTVTLLSNLFGSQTITMTQGTFDLSTYTVAVTSLVLNGGVFQATNSAGVMASSSAQSGTSVFNAPASFTINNSDFTYTAGTFNHNNGTLTYVNRGVNPQTFSANGLTLYNLIFNNTTSDSVSQSRITGTFTVNDFTLTDNGAAGRIDYIKSGTCVINVSGNLNFPSTAGSGIIRFSFTDYGLFTVNLSGNLVMSDADVLFYPNINFVGAGAQTITRTAGTISSGAWIVDKTNFTDTVTQASSVLTPTSLAVTKGIYDLGGYNLTTPSLTVSSGSTFRLKGDETVTNNLSTTFSAGSTVEYYATSSSRAIKSWTHTTGTLKINGAGGVFTLPANSTISTTTISAGTLSLNGYNLTTALLTNNSTLRRIGSETITISTSTRSGTIEYVGDADGIADNYNVSNISNLNYHNLSIASTDITDTYTFPATINISGNLTKTAGTISAASTAVTLSGTNQTVSVDAPVTVSALTKVVSTANDILSFGTTGSLVITGATTLQGTASYPLSLRSTTPATQWLFDPQGARNFSYLDVQDSWNVNALGINSPSITGFVNSGNNTNWGIILLPTVTSSAATNISTTTVTFTGNITDTSGADVTDRGFEYGFNTGYGTIASTTGTYGVGEFLADITGLIPNTLYHYRSFAVNSGGTGTSTDRSFTTLVALPTITSSPATSINASGATLNANITNTGGENNTVRGFEYGLTTAYGTATSTTDSYGTGAYTAVITGLSSETLYHYRAFSTNSAGTSSSTDQTFTTLDINSPVITILGSNPAFVNQNATYTDAGATSTDTVDGDLTSSIITTNNVNTAIVGNSSVVYTVSDTSGNSAISTRVVTVLDITAPTLTSITSATTSSSATITWTTNEPATSQVQYGPSTSYGDLTTTSDLTGNTTHTVILPNLISCANYYYRVISTDLYDNTATSSGYTFFIAGCTGDSSVLASSTEETLTAEGGTVILNELNLEAPADFTATTSQVVFQAKELAESEFFVTVTVPDTYTFIGDFIYNLKTFIDSTTILPDFILPLTITITYDPATLGSITESSLVIYRYDAPTWTPLTSCSVNTTLHTVTCTTTRFSDFGLFGKVVEATSVTTRSSGTHFGCKDPKATNYEFFSAHRQSLCQYALAVITPVATNPVTIKPLVITTSTTTKYTFTRNLKLYMTGPDVLALQKYLNVQGFIIATTGPGSSGNETTMFGGKTQAALIKYQKAKGITPAVGYFGPITRGWVGR